ncbi:MAG: penicillin-binding protein activator [Gemmatimonadota bacterium]
MNTRIGWLLALSLLGGACATVPVAEVPAVPEDAVPERRDDEPAREAPLRIGMVLSTSGSATLQQYAQLVLDGARIGADAGAGGRSIELVVQDDGGTSAGAARAVRELESAGVDVIIGPLTDESLAAAARARSSEDITLIAPMAVAEIGSVGNVYALNVVDTRGSVSLGEYARRYARVGVLHSRAPEGTRQARAFADAWRAGGGTELTEVSFQTGATNLANELARLREARIDALYFPAGNRELIVVLPQFEYYGLEDVQLLGGESWVSDGARGLPQRVLEGAIVATPLLRDSRELAWQSFVQSYEARYRRSLQNPVPALGYDAVLLATRIAAGGAAANAAFPGATGVLTIRDDAVTRKPFLVRIEAGRLVPVQ